MISNCLQCNKAIRHKPSKVPRFCSIACKSANKRTRPRNDPRPCSVCGTIFTPARGRGDAKYCSQPCIWKGTGRQPEYEAMIAGSRARGERIRGTGTKTYVKRGGRHEHRVVAEQMLGRPLKSGEIVHHIDGDKHNNDPSNLAIMSQGQHMKEHGLGIPGMTLWWKPWEYRK